MHGRVLVAHKRGMAIRHGNKTYFQILLDPHKAELVKFLAKAKGVKATSWIRTTVYERLADDCEQLYIDAVEKDAQAKETDARRSSRHAAVCLLSLTCSRKGEGVAR